MNFKRAVQGMVVGTIMAGVAVADTYKSDPTHANVGFSVRHLVISSVRGHFKDFDATLALNEQGQLTEAKAVIKAASIDTGMVKRDEHLHNADFFDVAKYPDLTFQSKSVEVREGKNVIVGDFTMHGVTKEVVLPYTINGPIKDPWGNTKIGFEASLTINRVDYGLTWNKVLEAGGVVVGEEVNIEINVEFAKEESPPQK